MFKNNTSYWEPGTIEKRIGNVIYIIQGPKFSHKRHLNQIRKRLLEDSNGLPQEEEEVMDTIFDTFNMQRPQAISEPRKSSRKRKFTEPLMINPKRKKY